MLTSSARSYDADSRERRSVMRVAFWFVTFVIGSFAFAYAWRLYGGPYKDFLTMRVREQGKAREYLTSDVCANVEKRAKLEGYNDCERSEDILAQSASALAFYDLMTYLNVCHKGTCIIGGINVTDSLWFIGRLSIILAAAIYILSAN